MGISLYHYNQAANDLVSCYKKKKEFSAGEALANLMVERAGDVMKKAQVITWAPSSKASIKRLGFDHGAHLVKLIAKEIKVPVLHLYTPPKAIQKGLIKEERVVNAQGIKLRLENLEKCRGKSVLIIDDVYTTGSTIERCRSLLMGEGIQVKYLTFSRL